MSPENFHQYIRYTDLTLAPKHLKITKLDTEEGVVRHCLLQRAGNPHYSEYGYSFILILPEDSHKGITVHLPNLHRSKEDFAENIVRMQIIKDGKDPTNLIMTRYERGVTIPDEQDYELYNRFVKLGANLEIGVLDYIIYNEYQYFSISYCRDVQINGVKNEPGFIGATS